MCRCEEERMGRCEDEKMICAGVKKRRCEDVKNVSQTPTIRRTLRSDALGKKHYLHYLSLINSDILGRGPLLIC